VSAGSKQAHARPRAPRQTIFMKRCPTTKKRGYENKADAVATASRASRAFGVQRAYKCPFCRLWHLTTKPKRSAA
jgi:hypothetical protein